MIGKTLEEQRVRLRYAATSPANKSIVCHEAAFLRFARNTHNCVSVNQAHDTSETAADVAHEGVQRLDDITSTSQINDAARRIHATVIKW